MSFVNVAAQYYEASKRLAPFEDSLRATFSEMRAKVHTAQKERGWFAEDTTTEDSSLDEFIWFLGRNYVMNSFDIFEMDNKTLIFFEFREYNLGQYEEVTIEVSAFENFDEYLEAKIEREVRDRQNKDIEYKKILREKLQRDLERLDKEIS